MHAYLPIVCDTGLIRDLIDDDIFMLCDHLNETRRTTKSEVIKLRWSKKTYRVQNESLLLITRVWVSPMGTRKLRIQCHIIDEKGRFGPRLHLEERHQGRIKR